MLPIKDAAKILNISTQAIYRKINITYKQELKNHISYDRNRNKVIDDIGLQFLKETLKNDIKINNIEENYQKNFKSAVAKAETKIANVEEVYNINENKTSDKQAANIETKVADDNCINKKTRVDGESLCNVIASEKTNIANNKNIYNKNYKKKGINEVANNTINVSNKNNKKELIEELKKRIEFQEKLILKQEETISSLSANSSKQIEKLQILLAREQEKNIGLLSATVNNKNFENNNKDTNVINEENKRQKPFFKRLFNFGRG